jgi:hypothetical protein
MHCEQPGLRVKPAMTGEKCHPKLDPRWVKPAMTGEKPPELLMELDNVAGLWQIYIDVIAGLTRNPRWLTQSALQ